MNGSDGLRSPIIILTNPRGTRNGLVPSRRSSRDKVINTSTSLNYGAILLCFFTLAAGSPSVPPELNTLYDQKQYQKVLDELAKLNQETSATPDVRRLKIHTLLKLGNPKDALAE